MQSLLSLSPAPVLPLAGLAHWALLALWGVVLAWLVLSVVTRLIPTLSPRVRAGTAAAVFACNLLPALLQIAPASPAYWLGLAFQSPSLVLVAIALYGLWAHTAAEAARIAKPWQVRAGHVVLLCVLGILLGWVLLLDTLAFWPRSVYALGFGAGTVWGVALLLALLAWRWQGLAVWVLCAVLLVFAMSRLPSGNVWDALLDPLLWAGLHIKLFCDLWAQKAAKVRVVY
jgi:hypothetical protein